MEIIEGIQDDRNARRAGKGQPLLEQATAWAVGEDGKLHHKVDSGGNDSDWDSVELMVGALARLRVCVCVCARAHAPARARVLLICVPGGGCGAQLCC